MSVFHVSKCLQVIFVLCNSICKYTLKIQAGLYECGKDKCHSSEGKTKHLLHFASLAPSVVSLTHPMLGGY
jgi:hypothetical protein